MMTRLRATHRLYAAFVLLLLALVPLAPAHACSTVSTTLINLGSKTSYEAIAAETNAGSGSSGLSCPGLLSLLSNQHIYLSVDAMSSGLINAVAGDSIPYSVLTTPGGVPLAAGSTSGNLATTGLLHLSGTGGDAQIYVNLGAAPNVAAGTYTGTVTLRWRYATCRSISAVGICIGGWNVSPGITQSCALGLCTINTASIAASVGLVVNVTVRLEIDQDCRFDADDIDFGRAPFVESFTSAVGALRVRCTKGSTYTVGLSEGANPANGRRRMASGANRLEYDVFHAGGVRWGKSANRAVQNTGAQGNVAEIFNYEARIYMDQPTPPIGVYQDQLIIDVEF